MRTVKEFEKATNKCQKPMSDYSRIIVETDEKSPKTLAVITDDDCETIEGLRVRFLPVYNLEVKTVNVNNYDAKTGERIAEVKLSPEQSARLIRVLKEAR